MLYESLRLHALNEQMKCVGLVGFLRTSSCNPASLTHFNLPMHFLKHCFSRAVQWYDKNFYTLV